MKRQLSTLLLSRFRPDLPAGGAALRNRQNIHALSQLGPVDVISIGETLETLPVMDAPPPVRQWTSSSLREADARRSHWERLRARWWMARPGIHSAVDRYRRSSVAQELQRLLADRPYDVVVVEELSLAGYLPQLRRPGLRVVFDAHNVESRLRQELSRTAHAAPSSRLRRYWQHWCARRLFAEEQRAVRQADLVWACSAIDAQELQRLYGPEHPVTVVPNGIDVAAYRQNDRVPAEADWSAHPITLSFLGTYSYRPNEDAALILITDVLPRLATRARDPQLVLIGRDPTPAMQRAAAGRSDITITGAVPSILPHLRPPSIVTLPLTLGSGTRLKILEAFASDRPVVSTRKGAEGLEVADDQHLLLRETPEDMAEAVIQLWFDRKRRAALCTAAHRCVGERYSWSAAAHAIATSLTSS